MKKQEPELTQEPIEEFNPTNEQREEQCGENVVELRGQVDKILDDFEPIQVKHLYYTQKLTRLRNKIAMLTSESIENSKKNRGY